jgi:CRP-like cAMP-binding protein
VLKEMGFTYFSQGATVFKKGEKGDYFFIVVYGQIDLFLPNPQIKPIYKEIEQIKKIIY